MSTDGAHIFSHWNPSARSNSYSSLSHNVDMPHYQPEASGLSRDPYLHPSTPGSFCMVPENYGHHASSSNHAGQTFHGVEDGFFEHTMGSGRGPYKRKSPGVPAVRERGSTSRYHDASSSNVSMPSDLWQEKPNGDFHHAPWEHPGITPGYRGNSLSIGGESTIRNVRSRAAFDLEADLARTHLSSSSRHSHSRSQPSDHSRSVDLLSQNSNASTQEWNPTLISPASHGKNVVSNTNAFSQETNHFNGSSSHSASLEIGHYNNDIIGSRTPVPQSLQGTSTQPARGLRSSYSQRSAPTFGTNLRQGHAPVSDEGFQMATESYSSRHRRPFSNIGWRNSDRNARSRIYSERYRALADEAAFRDRLGPEGYYSDDLPSVIRQCLVEDWLQHSLFSILIDLTVVDYIISFPLQGLVIVDRSAWYGTRNMYDHHREMRLDVDDMSYEELLALGERIGNVSTGLSEDLISMCLMESIYCSSDQIQEDGSCVICLEEYKNMDDVGMLKACRHDFHVSCITKWLSMKKICPICKACALADKQQDK
ncbi:hypothetical protein RJ640_007207 [Escallonia rubra]|uniref:RING-type E3 ubiquitin transferase n=1 Tax=Escallonia rubra TaxID=112253 RepID=A0AA88QX34_9ASTE|nr:hypothetical protein RJ640_000446 [Escallonia rubra]KAK2972145.1 hypothetical protein RJ640_007206 [Escallonia rubra]KAK2977571.1 hypothetical protein RJ640_007207 [Escallonia rubra]